MYLAVNQNPDGTPAETYVLDIRHAGISGNIMHNKLSHFAFFIEDFSVTFDCDLANPEASQIEVTINPSSFHTSVEALIDHLRQWDFFDVANFLEIKFVSTGLQLIEDNKGVLTGNITAWG